MREPLLNLDEAAAHLKISKRALRELCHRQSITYSRIGRYDWRFRVSDLETFLERRTVRCKPVYR